MIEKMNKGRITLVGIGPGALDQMTFAVRLTIERADVIIGYKTYIQLIDGIAPGVARYSSGMRQEVSRVNQAIENARNGLHVVLVSSGDSGIYGMAGLVYEILHQQNDTTVPVTVLPGVSSIIAAGALLGAPLMNDFCSISLSDQLVPLKNILHRVEMAARGGFVICLLNPKSRRRTDPFYKTCDILASHRAPETPVGIVRSAYRDEQSIDLIPLECLRNADVDMVSIVVVGNEGTFIANDKMITRRGYKSKYDLENG
jgi:precorrin-3B C17-methyltransferase